MSPLIVGSGSTGSDGRSDRLGLPTGTSDPGTAEAGDLYYKTDTDKIRYYDGTAWADLASGGGGGGTVACKTTEAMRVLGSAIGNMSQEGGTGSAFDGSIAGDFSTGARKDPSAGATIGRNFGESVGVSGITIYRPDGNGTSGSNCFPGEGDGTYEFQYSSDGSSWTTIETIEGTTNKSVTVSFTKTDAQYWRVLFSGNSNGGTVQEMQFHCSEPPVYEIAQSALFDSDLVTKLTRTFGSGISTSKFSFSWWQKMLSVKENNVITSQSSSGCIRFMASGTTPDLNLSVKIAGATLESSRDFRDFTGWQHFLITFDGTVGNAEERVRIYCNGEPVSYSGGSSVGTSVTALGAASNEHVVGGQQHNNSHAFDGYLAEMHWCDGLVKYPTDFAQINPATKQWDPIAYGGSYGSEGWYLKFGNSGNYGQDSSGNSNNFSQSGFSLSPSTRHQSVDSPSNYGTATQTGGEVRGNYCTFDPSFNKPLNTSANPDQIRYGNLTVSHNTGDSAAIGTMSVSSGKWYWEGKWITLSPTNDTSGFGFYKTEIVETNNGFNTYGSGFRGHRYRGTAPHYAYTGSANDVTITTATAGDWYGLALDIDNNIFTIYRNGTLVVTTTAAATAGNRWIPATFGDGACELEFNFGQEPWNYAPPAGYNPMCSAMLADPYYVDSTECFGQIIWTGTGSGGTRTITDTHAVEFVPDFVWSKSYNGTAYHNQFYDAVRTFTSKASGVGALVTDLTSAEGTPSGGYLSNTGAGSITYSQEGTGNGYEWYDQNNSHDYVARCWNAGGVNQTITNGDITATVRANQNCGFSIVGWQGPNNTNDHDVPHGLSKAPEFIIVKNRDTSFNWDIYHYILPDTESFVFSGAAGRTVNAFQNEDPSATTFPVKHNYTTNQNDNYIAYCWHSVEGTSSFGSYIGNGSNDGPVYNCGFRPSLVIVKGDGASQQWFIHDDARDPEKGDGNPSTKEMAWETAQVQYDTVGVGAGQRLDIFSNGFKIRSSNGACNTSGIKYSVMAWARSPFKYARAR